MPQMLPFYWVLSFMCFLLIGSVVSSSILFSFIYFPKKISPKPLFSYEKKSWLSV